MPWQLLSSTPKGVGAPGRWYEISLPPVPALLSYGFRLEGVGLPPSTWQLGGYWGVLYTCDGELCSTSTQSFLVYPSSVSQPIRVLGGTEIEIAGGAVTSLACIVSVNAWVPFTSISLLGLTT